MRTSAPAISAMTPASTEPHCLSTAPIPRESVTMSPPKPMSFRRNDRVCADIVAGTSVAPSAGTIICAVMTDGTPSAAARRNGTSSTDSSRARSWSMRGNPRCESTSTSPCPGKCLAHASTPSRANGGSIAATNRATSPASEPNERTPMTGLSGFELTSATGA